MEHADVWPEEQLLSFVTSGTSNQVWRVWDLRTRKEIYGQSGDTNHWEPWRAFVPSQRRSLEYTHARTLHFRNIPSGSIEAFVSCDLGDGTAGENDSIALAMSANGRFAAAAGLGRLHIWDVTTKVKLHEIETAKGAYKRGILISADGKSLIARGQELTHWRLDTGGSRVLPGGFNNAFKLLSDGRLGAADEEGSVAVHDLVTGTMAVSFNGGYRRYCDLTLSPDNKRLVLAGWSGFIQFWDLESQRQIALARASEHQRFGSSVGFLDENTMASVFNDELRIWRALSWEEIEREEATQTSSSLKKEEMK
ncbi:MAG: WD40 repeat domain-containing protein [Verrucomicrobiales bacterium]|nr:WD40 repeat domain-containing protein [Verrucomicrobiales bacterium]